MTNKKFNTGQEVYLEFVNDKYRLTLEFTYIEFNTYEEAHLLMIEWSKPSPWEKENKQLQEWKDIVNKRTPDRFLW